MQRATPVKRVINRHKANLGESNGGRCKLKCAMQYIWYICAFLWALEVTFCARDCACSVIFCSGTESRFEAQIWQKHKISNYEGCHHGMISKCRKGVKCVLNRLLARCRLCTSMFTLSSTQRNREGDVRMLACTCITHALSTVKNVKAEKNPVLMLQNLKSRKLRP